MPSKRIRSSTPNTSGSGGGTTTTNVPSARWSEDTNVSDEPVIGLKLADDVNVDDAFAYLIAKEGEDFNVDDGWSQFIQAAFDETANFNDLTKMLILNVINGPSGTPDNDFMFDSRTNQAAATTNYGNSTIMIAKGASTVPGSDESRGYLCVDLTGFSGCTGFTDSSALFGNSAYLQFRASNSNALLASNMSWAIYYNASKPFTESTVTWNAPPSLGTLLASGTISVAAGGAFANYSIAINAAGMSLCYGKYMTFVFTGTGGALPDTYTVQARDHGTVGQRPFFNFAAQRGT